MTELAAVLSESAAELKVFDEPFAGRDEAVSPCAVGDAGHGRPRCRRQSYSHPSLRTAPGSRALDDVEGFIAEPRSKPQP